MESFLCCYVGQHGDHAELGGEAPMGFTPHQHEARHGVSSQRLRTHAINDSSPQRLRSRSVSIQRSTLDQAMQILRHEKLFERWQLHEPLVRHTLSRSPVPGFGMWVDLQFDVSTIETHAKELDIIQRPQ